MSSKLYVFAGPNGSGKSTIIKDYIIFHNLFNVEYICPDIYASTIFFHIKDVKKKYQKAMDFASYKRERLLVENKSMLIETVLSSHDKIEFIKKAKQAGFRIISIFVGTSSPTINIFRVQQRVSEGGHNVPEEKIISRYSRSMENLPLLAQYSNELYIYDNSGMQPLLAMSIIDGKILLSTEAPDWVKIFLK